MDVFHIMDDKETKQPDQPTCIALRPPLFVYLVFFTPFIIYDINNLILVSKFGSNFDIRKLSKEEAAQKFDKYASTWYFYLPFLLFLIWVLFLYFCISS
jgi:hypothetical protein